MNFETSLDKSIDFALDCAIKFLDEAREFYPFCFMIDAEGKIISVVPQTDNDYPESTYLIDTFKDFAGEKMQQPEYIGFCVTYNVSLNLNEGKTDAVAIFLKFKNDNLPLKTRIYYFPYLLNGEKPQILFDLAFSSEA